MKKMLGALLASSLMASAAAASAATITTVDFNSGQVGTRYDLGVDRLALGYDMIVAQEGGEKFLQPTPIPWEAAETTLFYLIGQRWYPDADHKLWLMADVLSIDIYTEAGGYIRGRGNSALIPLTAGWQTLSDIGCSDGFCYAWIHGDGVRLDNMTFSYEIAAIPEPSTWAMLIVGFGLTGTAIRCRRTTATLA